MMHAERGQLRVRHLVAAAVRQEYAERAERRGAQPVLDLDGSHAESSSLQGNPRLQFDRNQLPSTASVTPRDSETGADAGRSANVSTGISGGAPMRSGSTVTPMPRLT